MIAMVDTPKGNFANVDFERMCQIDSMVANGTAQPASLTPDEVDAWVHAEHFYQMAEQKGLTVHVPHDTAGTWSDQTSDQTGDQTDDQQA